jgi:hypothetical protein
MPIVFWLVLREGLGSLANSRDLDDRQGVRGVER